MSNDCFQQSSYSYKNTDTICFACRGELSGIPKILELGHVYEACSPLVQDSKSEPMRPMTAIDECIVAFVGNCEIDATAWTENCKVPVYDEVIVYKQRVNWPKDEEGNQIFTVEDLELVYQGHTCCIRFIDLKDCPAVPAWLEAQNQTTAKA